LPVPAFFFKLIVRALVAQRLEQQTHNLLAVGSNPTEGMPQIIETDQVLQIAIS
jgi:hypothetical protein